MKISVVMAAYNGRPFISQQIESILTQLGGDDELIVSVDPSSDGTYELLCDLSLADSRLQVYPGPGQGLVANFENAIKRTSGDIIFLSDQDDIWLRDKTAKVAKAFKESGAAVVIHDAEIVDGSGEVIEPSFFAWRNSEPGYWRNIWKNSYIGCCMAFTAQLKDIILPFPAKIPMHDQWIGLLAERKGGTYFLPDILLSYRRHGANASSDSHADIGQMLAWRWKIVRELRKRVRKCR